ncbi:hypothetical protein LJC60_11225, partial [Ruminococcaceae bacterium OttesenSCG-928-D13]|nr:hypothetical protein [Ruminococcaceae bacterium OttesenSCG-928-D13]
KPVLALFLCMVLTLSILAGCNKDGGDGDDDLGNVTYGRYVEVDITPEGMSGYPNSFTAFEGGVLDLVSEDIGDEDNHYMSTYYRWRSTDQGETWQPVNMDWTKPYINDYSDYYDNDETPPEQISLGQVIPMADGDLLAFIHTWVNDVENDVYSSKTDLVRVDASGNVTPFSIPEYDALLSEGRSVNIYNAEALPGDRLFLSLYINPTEEEMNDPNFDWDTTNPAGVYDLNTGAKLYEFGFNVWDVIYNENALFYNDWEKGFQAFNITDGTPYNGPMPKGDLQQQLGRNDINSTYVDNDYNFYNVNARGMDKYTPEGTVPEKVMDGLNYTYGSPLYRINNMTYDPGNDTLIMAVYENYNYENMAGKLLKYTWDDEAIASSDRKIRVYSLYDNNSVRLALSQYKRQFPDVTIEYETAFASTGDMVDGNERSTTDSDGNAMTEEDALRALNTELLNGTGPDVLILDGLPVESFIDKGVLEDLTELVSGNDDLFEAIFTPLAKDGKYYALPTNFFIPSLMGEKGYVEQFTSFDSLMTAIKEGAGIPGFQEMDPDWTEEEQQAYWESMYGPKPAEEQPVLYFETLPDIFETLYASCAPAIFTEKGGIDQQNLATFLQAVKDVYDKYDIGNTGYDAEYGSSNTAGAMSTGYAYYEYTQSMNRYQQRQSRLGYTRLGSYNILENTASSLHWSGQANQGKGWVDDVEPEVDEEGNPIEGSDVPDTAIDDPEAGTDAAAPPADDSADASGISVQESSSGA